MRDVTSPDSVFIFLLKTDSLKNEIWRKILPTFGFYRGIPVGIWQNDNTISMAVCFFDSHYFPTAGLIQTDLQGNLINFTTYPHQTYNYVSLRAATSTSDGQMLLAGRIVEPPYVGVLKTPLTGIEERDIPFSLSTLKVFPNPSRGLVNFQYPAGEKTKLKIYDASGRLILEQTIQNQLKIKLPTGIYFYQMKNQTGKIIILE
ncbi:MAG: T9SS type A sorting domain-containing protein [candidate division WOR-3 bacterium]